MEIKEINKEILVGDFDENDCKNGIDKIQVEQKKKETGLQYTNTKIIKKNGKLYLRIWVCDFKTFKLF